MTIAFTRGAALYTAPPVFAIIPGTIKGKGEAAVKAALFHLPTVGNRREIEAGMAGLRAISISRCRANC